MKHRLSIIVGSTGVPKTRINVEDFRIDYSNFSETLSDKGFPRGADWLSIGPTGPRRAVARAPVGHPNVTAAAGVYYSFEDRCEARTGGIP